MWLSRPTQSVYRIAPRIPSLPFPPLRGGRGRLLPPLFRGSFVLGDSEKVAYHLEVAALLLEHDGSALPWRIPDRDGGVAGAVQLEQLEPRRRSRVGDLLQDQRQGGAGTRRVAGELVDGAP